MCVLNNYTRFFEGVLHYDVTHSCRGMGDVQLVLVWYHRLEEVANHWYHFHKRGVLNNEYPEGGAGGTHPLVVIVDENTLVGRGLRWFGHQRIPR